MSDEIPPTIYDKSSAGNKNELEPSLPNPAASFTASSTATSSSFDTLYNILYSNNNQPCSLVQIPISYQPYQSPDSGPPQRTNSTNTDAGWNRTTSTSSTNSPPPLPATSPTSSNTHLSASSSDSHQSPYASTPPMMAPLADNESVGSMPARKRSALQMPSSLRRLSRSFSDHEAIEAMNLPGEGGTPLSFGNSPVSAPFASVPPSAKPIAVPSHLSTRRLSRSATSDSEQPGMATSIIPASPINVNSPPIANIRLSASQRRRNSILDTNNWISSNSLQSVPQSGNLTPPRLEDDEPSWNDAVPNCEVETNKALPIINVNPSELASLPPSTRQSVVDPVFERRVSTSSSVAGTDEEGGASSGRSESEGVKSPPLQERNKQSLTGDGPVEPVLSTLLLSYRPPPPHSVEANSLPQSKNWSLRKLHKEVFQSLRLNIFMHLNGDGMIQHISPVASDLFGYKPEELINKPPTLLIEDAKVWRKAVNGLMFTKISSNEIMPTTGQVGTEIRYRACLKDGRWVQMVAKGIAIYDLDSGVATSTIWITSPVALIGTGWDNSYHKGEIDENDVSSDEADSSGTECNMEADAFDVRMATSPATENVSPPSELIPSEPAPLVVACNICERTIPSDFFEEHTIVCKDLHQVEQEIMLVNDDLKEIHNQVSGRYEELREQIEDLDDIARIYVGRLTFILKDAISIVEEAMELEMPKGDKDTYANIYSTRLSMNPQQLLSPSTILIPKDNILPIPLSTTPSTVDVETNAIISASVGLSESNKVLRCAEWKPPNEVEFYPPPISTTSSAPSLPTSDSFEKIVDPDLAAVGISTLQQCLLVTSLVNSKGTNFGKMMKALEKYNELAIREELRKQELHTNVSATAGFTGVTPSTAVDITTSSNNVFNSKSIKSSNVEPGIETEFQDTSSRTGESASFREDVNAPMPRPLTKKRGNRSARNKRGRTKGMRKQVHASTTPLLAAGGPQVSKFKTFFNSFLGGDASRERRSGLRTSDTPPDSSRSFSTRLEGDNSELARSSLLRHKKLSEFQSLADLAASRDGGMSSSDVSLTTHSSSTAPGSVNFNDVQLPSSPSLTAPTLQRAPPSIKDFDIIKPISKGAFGSVYLAKKKLTGEYFAVKVLRKSDMVAKNQVTNIKAERMILTQLDSPYVVKLYFSFQTEENLYLVMEYLNGGDCAALIKSVGQLDEKWAKSYIVELVLALEYLHERSIIHRDLKPDNMLIDQNGHVKLTDFGLSRAGFRGRTAYPYHEAGDRSSTTTRIPAINAQRSSSNVSTASNFPPLIMSPSSVVGSSDEPVCPSTTANPWTAVAASFSPQFLTSTSAHLRNHSRRSSVASIPNSIQADVSNQNRSHPTTPLLLPMSPTMQTAVCDLSVSVAPILSPIMTGTPPSEDSPSYLAAKPEGLVGTPDYIAPESISDVGQASVDWWAVGVILYEFLYGFPPFHAGTPSQVFENILNRKIDWQVDEVDISPEARDLMERLMTSDFRQRLGSNGATEVKAHPFFADVKWNELPSTEPSFVPKVKNDEDTEYFDTRGAEEKFLDEDIEASRSSSSDAEGSRFALGESQTSDNVVTFNDSSSDPLNPSILPIITSSVATSSTSRRSSKPETPSSADFGDFVYKNLPALEKANAVIVKKLQSGLSASGSISSISDRGRDSRTRNCTVATGAPTSESGLGTVSSPPSISVSEAAVCPKQASAATNVASKLSIEITGPKYETPAFSDQFKLRPKFLENVTRSRRNSLPSRLRTQNSSPIARKDSANSLATGSLSDTSSAFVHANVINPNSQGGLYSPEQHLQTAKQQLMLQQHARSKSGSRGHARTSSRPGPSKRGESVPEGVRPMDVMVADDNDLFCRVMGVMLRKLKCRYILVRSGAEAIRSAMGLVKFDVIFMDVRMPIIDGQAACRMIKYINNINQSTPIIGITAFEQTDRIIELFDDVIAKPIPQDIIKSILGLVADAKQGIMVSP